MADARFPDRWLSDRRFLRLSGDHLAAYIMSLAWSVSNRTDGVLEPDDLRFIPHFGVGAPQAFVDAGLWTPQGTGWLITDYVATQTSRDLMTALENTRAREREKKARQRAAKLTRSVPGDIPGNVSPKPAEGQTDAVSDRSDDTGLTSTNPVVPGDIPRDIPRDSPGTNPGEFTGKARQGKDSFKGTENSTSENSSGQHHLCRYCDTELPAHMPSQRQRGYCHRVACQAEARAELTSA